MYGADLPRKFGRRARSIVQQPIYRRIFNTGLADDSTAADEWALTNGSEWMAKAIQAGITGNRADGIVWDDLIKGREAADSDVQRQKIWDAYWDDLLSRKKPGAFEIGITTRWHEDDPAGRILPITYNGESGWVKGRDGNDWYVLCLPAECDRPDDPLGREIGEILWPEWFTPDHFAPYKLNARSWNALYQQKPAPDSGDFFQSDWLKPYGDQCVKRKPRRDTMQIYGASDYAVTADGGDYTVHIVVGIDPNDDIFILDLWRQQASSDVWVEAMCDMVQVWKPIGWAEEKGQIASGVGPLITKRLRERKLYLARVGFPSRVEKEIRAQPIRGRMAQNGLYCPFHAPWFPAFKSELMSFPVGRNDDQADALGLIGQVLDRMVRGRSSVNDPDHLKVLSTDPSKCTVTLEDMFQANERRRPSKPNLRIA